MPSAAGLYRVQLALAAAGVALALLALGVVVQTLSFDTPSIGALAAACGSFTLPHVTTGSVALLVTASVSFAVVALAVRSGTRQLRARRRFLRSLRIAAPSGNRGAVLFEEPRPQAFCTGLLRPRVYVSTGAVEVLEHDELIAVLEHEAHHAQRRDPLRIFVGRTLADGLFFLPVLRRLTTRYEALAELAADAAAVRRTRDARPLAAALLVFDERAPSTVVGIAPERVDALLGERPRWELPLALLAGAGATLIAALAAILRLADATAQTTLNLPLAAAQLCMLLMALAPPAIGAAALLGSRRVLLRRRRSPATS